MDWELEGYVYIMPNMILYSPGRNLHHGLQYALCERGILNVTVLTDEAEGNDEAEPRLRLRFCEQLHNTSIRPPEQHHESSW